MILKKNVAALFIFFAFILINCGGKIGNSILSAAKPASVTGISLKESTSILIGSTEALYPVVSPAKAYDNSVTWESSDTAVATVDTAGTVTGIAAGNAAITATTVDGGFTASCAVTVSAVPVSLTEISFDTASLEIAPGKTGILNVIFTPSNATNQNITWYSSDTAIATVESSGQVTGVAAGTAIITATAADGGFTASCTVTVNKIPDLSVLIVSPGALSPAFSATTTSYAVTVDSSTTSFSVQPTSSDASDTVTVNSTTVAAGYNAAVYLSSSPQTVTVTVTSTANVSRVYTLTVTKTTEGTVSTPMTNFELVLAKSGTDTVTFPTGYNNTGTASVTTPFLIATTETTYVLWNTVKTDSFTTSYFTFNNTGTCGSSGSGSTDQPVTTISWEDAIVWCNALTHYYNTNTTGEDLTYAYTDSSNNSIMSYTTASGAVQVSGATGFRLPTSAEWQYCARYRGYTVPSFGTIFSEYIAQGEHSGSSLLTAGYYWTPGNYVSGAFDSTSITASTFAYFNNTGTSTVKSCLYANTFKIYDMSGNVKEMCFDKYSADTSYRSAWGGYYSLTESDCTVSSEAKAETDQYTGFRIVRSIINN